MSCKLAERNEVQEKYILGQLGEPEREDFERHVSDCKVCQTELANQRILIEGLRSVGLAEMKQEIHEQVAVNEVQPDHSWMRWAKVAAVLFVVVGTSSVFLLFRGQNRDLGRLGNISVEQSAKEEPAPAQQSAASMPDQAEESPSVNRLSQEQDSGQSGARERRLERAAPKPMQARLRQDLAGAQMLEAKARTDVAAQNEQGKAADIASATRTVRGTITDEKGNPLSGANVWVPGSPLGATTDTEGKYAFNVPDSTLDEELILEAQFIGYRSARDTLAPSSPPLIRDFTLQEGSLAAESMLVTRGLGDSKIRSTLNAFSGAATDSIGALSKTEGSVRPLLTVRRSEPPERAFELSGKVFLIRLQRETESPQGKQGVPASFPVKIAQRDPNYAVLTWLLPGDFSSLNLQEVLIELVSAQLLRAVLPGGHTYLIRLGDQMTEARLQN